MVICPACAGSGWWVGWWLGIGCLGCDGTGKVATAVVIPRPEKKRKT